MSYLKEIAGFVLGVVCFFVYPHWWEAAITVAFALSFYAIGRYEQQWSRDNGS